MAVLNSDALREIENKVIRWKRNGHTPYGYPLSEVTDLCDTISALKHEKKKWQRIAEQRGKILTNIASMAFNSIEQP